MLLAGDDTRLSVDAEGVGADLSVVSQKSPVKARGERRVLVAATSTDLALRGAAQEWVKARDTSAVFDERRAAVLCAVLKPLLETLPRG